jgi:uncharacterized protein
MNDDLLRFHLLAKPAGAACNLGCHYCFFLSKENLYQGDSYLMDESILETFIRKLMEASPDDQVDVAWQGGEPMLRGLNFFKRSVELVNQYRKPNQRILHTIQTNGTLINDEWAAFFKEHNYLVGLSIDGPRTIHNIFRENKQGIGSFDDVMRGWKCLRKHGVDVNILCTVNAANQDHPLDVYHFFRDELGAQYIQFIPVIERATEATIKLANQGWGGLKGKDRPLYKQEGDLVTQRSVNSEKFGQFLNSIFDDWVHHDVGKIYVTTFDIALGSWLGQHNSCIVSPTCGQAIALEHNGDVYSCDHYVEPDYLLGNIKNVTLAHCVTSEKQRRFGQSKFDTLPHYCKECPVLFACYGECPRNRFIKTPDGEAGLNYLCAGYKQFFMHIDAPMKVMANLIKQGRYADEIMALPQTSD